MRGAGALLVGLGSGLYFGSLERILSSLFWPRLGTGLFFLALLGAAAGAAAAFLLQGREAGASRKIAGVHLAWGASCLVALTALSREIAGGWPGMPGEVPGIPVALALILGAAPFLTAFIAAATEEGEDALRRGGLFLLALGAGVACSWAASSLHPRIPALAGILAGILPALAVTGRLWRAAAFLAAGAVLAFMVPSISPLGYPTGTARGTGDVVWSGASRLEFAPGEEGLTRLTVSGGLREIPLRGSDHEGLAIPLHGGGEERLQAVTVGIPDGGLLEELLSKEARVLIIERDPVVARELLRRWPLMKREGVRVMTGDARRYLASRPGTVDLLVLGGEPSAAAHLSAALASTEDYSATVEALKVYTASLRPRGLLTAERPGTARLVTALREATEESHERFRRHLVVTGRRGGVTARCYYRPEGFSREDMKALNRHARRRGERVFTSPESKRNWNLYYSLARGKGFRGYYFTSPQDLSPARDERPFFWHLERLMISPAGPPLPEEEGHQPEEWRLRLITPGSLITWVTVVGGFLLVTVITLVPLAVFQHRTGLASHALPYPWLFFLAGASLSALARALTAWGRWAASPAGTAAWLPGLFLLAAGAGWLKAPPREKAWRSAGFPLAFLAGLMAAGGYLLPLPGGASGWASVPAAALLSLAAGFLGGRLAGSLTGSAADVLPDSSPWMVSIFVVGAVVSWPASGAAAAAFGFSALWMLSAAGLLGAAWSGRRL